MLTLPTVLATVMTATLVGVEASLVRVEVDVSYGFPAFSVVGLPDASVRESRDRVRSAIRNSGLEYPAHRVTVNLAPGDVRKAGSSFDLPIALGVLIAAEAIDAPAPRDLLVVGELSLDGTLRATRGTLPIALAARRAGVRTLLLPDANAAEAALVGELEIRAAATLSEAVAALGTGPGGTDARPRPPHAHGPTGIRPSTPADLRDIRGQALARRALEIAAAGGHHLLMVGPPGAGKTMLARRLPGILPPLDLDEAIEVTSIHSVAGLLASGSGLASDRPFRAPHHSASAAALVGGGAGPRPGEVSLAHHGVLFLDELPEFPRHILDLLRQPLEEGAVTVARAARTLRFPAKFQLVAAMNPCPCGWRGDPVRECRCTPVQVRRYQHHLSGPFRDRIDLVVATARVPASDVVGRGQGEPSAIVRARVGDARARQARRYAGSTLRGNHDLSGVSLREHVRVDPQAEHLLVSSAERLALSARSVERVLRVARTIADLGGEGGVTAGHVSEALGFRFFFPEDDFRLLPHREMC